MQRKSRRTVIDISTQPGLDFRGESIEAEFTRPRYQERLLVPRACALVVDLAIVFAMFVLFLAATLSEMPGDLPINRVVLGAYGAAYLVLVVVYLSLFMLSTSQTVGMRMQKLIAVDREGNPLGTTDALLRSFGYLVSTVPILFGFLWAFIDPEHLSWTDRVSGTFVKRV
jgi:uncharacterized RDD family membrane protein YckC